MSVSQDLTPGPIEWLQCPVRLGDRGPLVVGVSRGAPRWLIDHWCDRAHTAAIAANTAATSADAPC